MSLLVHQDPSQPIDYKSGFYDNWFISVSEISMELIFRGDRPLGPSEVYTTGDSGGLITILNKQGMTLEDVFNIHLGLLSYLYHFFGVPWPSVSVPIPALDFVIRNQQNGTSVLGRLFRT